MEQGRTADVQLPLLAAAAASVWRGQIAIRHLEG